MKNRFDAAPQLFARRLGPRLDVRYMTRDQLFDSAWQILLAAAFLGAAGVLAAYLIGTSGASGAGALAHGVLWLTAALGGAGFAGSVALVSAGISRSVTYDPVSVWRRDLEARANRRRVRFGVDLRDSRARALEAHGADLLLQVDAYVFQSTGIPGADPGTEWQYLAEFRIRSGRVRGERPSLPAMIEHGSLAVGPRMLERLVRAPLRFKGLVRVEIETVDGGLLVIEGSGVKVDLRGPGRYIEDFDP